MLEQRVVPDVLDLVPDQRLEVIYPSGVEVSDGNELTPTQVQNLPSFYWESEDSLYTLALVDPDGPSREKPRFREVLHYLVTNIPGDQVGRGDTLVEYIGSGAPKGTGLHRYIFVVYDQGNETISSDIKIPKTSFDGRVNFSIRKFAEEHSLGEPLAANFFQAQYDDYVPKLNRQLGIVDIEV